MKQLLIIVYFCILSAFSFIENKDQIEYNDQQELNWSDYKGRPNHLSSFKALTATKVSFRANSDDKKLTLTIKNLFEPKKSWTKTNASENLLDHERLHFHISELFARKLRKDIIETKFKSSGQKLMNEISSLYQERMNELDKYQKRYDKETNHSIEEKKQKEWELQVFKELNELKKYSSSEITIQF